MDLLRAWLVLALGLPAAGPDAGAPRPVDPRARPYVEAVRRINEEHARRPGKTREADLAKRVPREARASLDRLLKVKDAPEAPTIPYTEALLACGEAALDLDLQEDFERVRARLEELSPEAAARLGLAISRPGFLLRGKGGLERGYLEEMAEVLEAILVAYSETFGFEEWSKVPGKKLRVAVDLDPQSSRPPHFAPQHPYHSQVDFPVPSGQSFRSPTPDGKFLFYGLCHELGHVISMWGDARREEDHHAWAHYTGVFIVEHLAGKTKDQPSTKMAVLERLGDARWRSLRGERERLKGKGPSLADRDGVLALLIAIHDRLGAKAIGAAMNHLDRQDRRLRVNRVRYTSFRELREALAATVKTPEEKRAVEELFRGVK